MFSPFKKPSNGLPDLNAKPSREQKPKKPMTREVKIRLWITAALSLVLLVVWYGCMAIGEATHNDAFIYGVMITYFAVFAVLLVVYLAYNRGFVNKNVTVEMLPPDWSEEKKQAFVEAEKTRAEKSRWMVTLIIPFVVVFMVEVLYLFVWEGMLKNLLENWGFLPSDGGN